MASRAGGNRPTIIAVTTSASKRWFTEAPSPAAYTSPRACAIAKIQIRTLALPGERSGE